MKNDFLFCTRSIALIGAILLPCASLADVIWPPIQDVTDEDIVILRNSRMPRGDTQVRALTQDIDITLAQTLTVGVNDCAPSHLLLDPSRDEGGARTITFVVTDYDLKFKMDSKHDEFSLEKIGGGDVVFEIDNDRELEFEPSHRVEPTVFPSAGTLVWHGTNPSDIADVDVIWNGKIRLPLGTTFISAINQDVSIFIKNKAEFKNNKNGASTLVLSAALNRTITIYLDHELEFEADNFFPLDLVMTGQGIVRIVRQL